MLRLPASVALSLMASILLIAKARAQGGPPFRTDDPETPGNRNWEINFGFIGDRNPLAGAYQVPDFDINYGLGDRIQLKYELPIALTEQRAQSATATTPTQEGYVLGGIGESLLGVKWRFYEHHPGDPFFGRNPPSRSGIAGKHSNSTPTDAPPKEPIVDLSVSTYPQLSLNNPTRSVPRGVVLPGPDFLLPLEVNSRIGPIRIDAEVGYHFANDSLPQSWIRGILVGHEFTDNTEAYLEFYDQQDANRVNGQPKQRETTLGLGGRQSLNRGKSLLLLLMGGRSIQSTEGNNGQPSWIAYVGLQVLLGKENTAAPGIDRKLPNDGEP